MILNTIMKRWRRFTMNKKICFISTHAYPLFNPKEGSAHGGSEVQLYTISKELAKDKSNEISFIVGDFNQKKVEFYNGVKVIKSFNPKSSGASIFIKGFQALKYIFLLLKENPNICITSSANSTVGVVGFYCFLFRKKHIHRTANIIDVNGYWIDRNGFLGRIYKFGLENATNVICQTKDQQKALLENHNIEAILFRNVFDFDNIKSFKKRDYVLWVGRASRTKRAEKFLELAKLNPKLSFVLIFNNQDQKYFEEIVSYTKKMQNLKFIEKVPFNRIQKYYDGAKVFVSTSEFEGFANTFVQSGIGKTPIITLGSNPDNFLDEYKCGFFANNSMKKLNSDLNKLFSDKKLYSQYSKNIFEYVRSKYDIKKNIKVIKKLL